MILYSDDSLQAETEFREKLLTYTEVKLDFLGADYVDKFNDIMIDSIMEFFDWCFSTNYKTTMILIKELQFLCPYRTEFANILKEFEY